MAEAGTAVCSCSLRPWKVAVANMPMRISWSGFGPECAPWRCGWWVKNGVNLADGAVEDAVGIGVQVNVRGLPKMNHGQIVLIDIADDPDVGEVGDGKGRGRSREGDAGGSGVGDILRDDDAGCGRIDLGG